MSRPPHVGAGEAQTFLAVLDLARSLVGDAAALPYLRGWLIARAGEPVSQRCMVESGGFDPADPRRESEPPTGPAHAAAVARVPLGRRSTRPAG